MIIIGLVILFTLGLLALPLLLKYLFWRAGFKDVQFRYIHPLRMTGFHIAQDIDLSFFKRIRFQLNDLQLFIRRRKIVLELSQPQLILESDSRMFQEIDFLKLRQEGKLLSNLQNVLVEALQYYLNRLGNQDKNEGEIVYRPSRPSNFSASLKGLGNFTVMLLTQLIEVDVRELSIEITPFQQGKYETIGTNELLRKKTLADFTLISQLLTLRFVLNHLQDLQFTVQDHSIKVEQMSLRYRELYKTVVEIKQARLVMQVPFTFSFSQSLSKGRIDLTVGEVMVNVVPSNFDEIFDLVYAIRFFAQLKKKCRSMAANEARSTEQQERLLTEQDIDIARQPAFAQFNILIVKVSIKLVDLYEQGIDSIESEPYLSSVSELLATGDNLSVKILPNSSADNLGILVQQLSLQIGLYESLADVFRVEPFEFKLKRNSDNQMEKLIRHGDIEVESGPAVIASLAKVFRLIVRTRRQHYDMDNYWDCIAYFLQQNSHHDPRDAELASILRNKQLDEAEVLLIYRTSKRLASGVSVEPNNILEYVVTKAVFNIKIRKLLHRLELQNFEFKRIYERSTVLNTVKLAHLQLEVEATRLKEFELGSTQLYVKQTQVRDDCNLFIKGLKLEQNEEALIEYLTGFPLVKSLLQISISSRTASAFRANFQTFQILDFQLKYLRATVTIDSTTLSFEERQPDMKEVNVHVKGTNVTLDRQGTIKKARFHFVDPENIKPTMKLISIGAVTLHTSLLEGLNRIKYNLLVRDARVIVPKELVAVGGGLQHCAATVSNLSIYIQAYLRNITDEQLRLIRLNQQNRLQYPQNVELKLLGLSVKVQDSEWNTVFLNYQRTVREYLSSQTIYNEQEIINELNRKKRTYGLVELLIKELSCEMSPIDAVRTISDAESWTNQLGNGGFEASDVANYHHSRLRFGLSQATLTIRDYPFDVVSISSLSAEAQLVKCAMKPTWLQNEQYYFFKGDAFLGEVSLTVGLNMSSAFQEIFKRTIAILEGFEKSKQRRQEESMWLEEINKLRNHENMQLPLHTSEYTPYWYIIKSQCFFSLSLLKKQDTKLSILTGIYPYSTQALLITVKQIYVLINKDKTTAAVHGIQLSKQWKTGQVFKAVDIGRVLAEVAIVAQPRIQVSCQVVFDNEHRHIVHIRSDLLQHLVNLNQLRTDILYLYGINMQRHKSRFGSIRGQNIEVSLIRWFSYAEIAKFVFDNELQKNRNTTSIWNVLQKIQLSITLKEFNVLMTLLEDGGRPANDNNNFTSKEETWEKRQHIPTEHSQNRTPTFSSHRQQEKQGLQFLIGRCKLKTSFIPQFRETNSEWVIRQGSGKIATTIGKYYTGKILRLRQVENLFARKTTLTGDRFFDDSVLRNHFPDYPKTVPRQEPQTQQMTEENLFFLTEALTFIRDHVHENSQGLRLMVKNFFQYEKVRMVLSSDMKRVLTRLLKMPSRHDLVVRTQANKTEGGNPVALPPGIVRRDNSMEEEVLSRRQYLRQKFRRCVKQIIHSRKHQRIFEVIQKTRLDFMFILNRPQFNIFYQQKGCQMILTSLSNCCIELRKEYLPYDTLQLDPKLSLQVRFASFEIWTSDQCSQVVWVQPSTVESLQVRQVLQARQTSFSLVDYELPSCDLNFQMTLKEILANKLSEQQQQQRKYLWANQQRIKRLQLQLEQVVFRIDRSQKRILLSIIEFIVLMISNKRRFVEEVRMAQAKSNQLKIYSKAKILKKLITKTSKSIMEETPRLESSFVFVLNHAEINFINRELSGQPCFLRLLTQRMALHIRQFDCNYFERSCEVQQIQMINPREPADSEYRTVLTMNHLGRTAATLQLHSYYESLFEKEVVWPYHKLMAVKLNPIKLRFSDQLYQQLYEYAFKNMQEQVITLNRYKIPEEIEEYYNRIIIEPVKVQLWYRSSNLLKRMDGISVTLEQFSKGNRFALRKQVFDIWVRFVLKQLTRQIFSVLGQKLFGGEEDQDSSDQAEHR